MGIDTLLFGTIEYIDKISSTLPTMSSNEKAIIINELVNSFANLALTANNTEDSSFDINELNDKLNLLLSALEGEDYVLISDLLQFEIKPLLIYWTEQL